MALFAGPADYAPQLPISTDAKQYPMAVFFLLALIRDYFLLQISEADFPTQGS